MKVIDLSPIRAGDQPINKLKSRLQGIFKFGFAYEAERKAQDEVEANLARVLNNKFTLIRNVMLEGLEIPIPCVLVGPSGLYVIYASGIKGMYRAKDEKWAEMNKATRKFEIARANLLTRSQLMAKVVDTYLTRNKQPHPAIQAALLFADPGAHVESVRPAVRVVLRDGFERFAAGILQERAISNQEEVSSIVAVLVKQLPAEEYEANADEQPPAELPVSPTPEETPKPARRVRFDRKQMILLGVMIAFEILILIGFAYLVFFY